MHGVIVEENSADHKGQWYILRVTVTGTLITHNTGHIQETPIMTEQYLKRTDHERHWAFRGHIHGQKLN